MVRFTDKAREFWLEQSLDKGEMPKRQPQKHNHWDVCYSFSYRTVSVPVVLEFLDGERVPMTIDQPVLTCERIVVKPLD